jgi:CubicO group peptidase (beta-lactamase class C family)
MTSIRLSVKASFATTLALTLAINTQAQKLNTAKLDSLIQTVDTNNRIMGALTLAENGKVLYNKAWGYALLNSKDKIKSSTETKYRIGSITKMFTTVMILQLVEEGKLQLNTPLATYYPNIPNAKDITIERMLNHHSGLYNFTDSTYLTYHTQPKTKEELLSIFEHQTPSFNPGDSADYSNTNFVLLGYILEKLTGESYANNLQKRITGKIGLKNTYIGKKANAANNEAASFNYDGEKWETEPETDMSIPGGAGCLVSTTNDLVKFIDALFNKELVSQASLDKMTDIKDGYGSGMFRFPFDEKYAYGHTGGIDEFHSMLGYFPKDHVAFAFTGNGQVMEMNDLAIGVLSICFNRPYTIPDFSFHLAVEALSRYEGTYSSTQFPLKIEIKKDGNKLRAQATGQGAFFLTPVSEKEFHFDPAKITLLFDIKEGKVNELTLKQSGMNVKFTKE